MNARDTLLKLRNDAFSRLKKLSPDDVAIIEDADRALAALSENKSEFPTVEQGEFAKLRIIEAAEVFLARVKRPVHIVELTQALADGGIKTPGDRSIDWKIEQSISWHVSKGRLKRHGDLISPIK